MVFPAGWDGVVLSRRFRNSASGEGRTHDGREMGMEEPTTGDAGRKRLEAEAEAALASQDATNLFRTDEIDFDAGTGIGAGADAIDKVSQMSVSVRGVTISRCVIPSGG
jgi:hypothetical protein